ncbi:MAG: hypothetical protein HND40_05410 [Ignavibacteriota bacterium]|jgi:hypothetical protein|nr:MAG: hypothetical protein F9K42_11590 [Ignavibacterium sp.]MBL1155647.1 hypothetical protein [Ignavibacteriota bacterium]MCO6449084.1 hypothetical protein [Ignavibacterium album]MCZ2267641.1 hypothetical protein [Ignavibacteriales bacterium]MDX9712969.1 hypothetical protein [Ignavibacteriaceae bacterium]
MSNKNVQSLFESLKKENEIFLNYLKAKFPLFHNSNVFSRDFEYGLESFLEKRGISLSYQKLEELSKLLSNYFESTGIFVKTSKIGWRLNYPQFITTKPGDPFSF